ncbi:hypothetical protein ACS0TY_023869 [Phlomoides rotata]
MGITVKIVRSVFLKSRSRDDTLVGSNNGVEKRKWSSSVRSYLCGDEHNSVVAAEDSESLGNSNLASFRSNIATNSTSSCGYGISSEDTTSVRSSEATVTQQIDESTNEKHQQHAAFIIQSAFRSFLARRRRDESKKQEDAAGTPSRGSIGTSVEAQTGNSSDIFSIKEESFNEPYKMRPRTRLKIQEDWDDSTVSSVISKMRMQSRVEAATRRERALAYAFSQQLRICSKKKVSCPDGDGTNTGWSWLERWMATRQPEITFAEEDSQKKLVRKRMLDVAIEEKESCGSNEVASLIEIPKSVPTPNKNRRSFSRQDSTTSSHLCPKESKKMCHIEDEKEKRKRQKQLGSKRDVIKNATTHEVPLQHETEQ